MSQPKHGGIDMDDLFPTSEIENDISDSPVYQYMLSPSAFSDSETVPSHILEDIAAKDFCITGDKPLDLRKNSKSDHVIIDSVKGNVMFENNIGFQKNRNMPNTAAEGEDIPNICEVNLKSICSVTTVVTKMSESQSLSGTEWRSFERHNNMRMSNQPSVELPQGKCDVQCVPLNSTAFGEMHTMTRPYSETGIKWLPIPSPQFNNFNNQVSTYSSQDIQIQEKNRNFQCITNCLHKAQHGIGNEKEKLRLNPNYNKIFDKNNYCEHFKCDFDRAANFQKGSSEKHQDVTKNIPMHHCTEGDFKNPWIMNATETVSRPTPNKLPWYSKCQESNTTALPQSSYQRKRKLKEEPWTIRPKKAREMKLSTFERFIIDYNKRKMRLLDDMLKSYTCSTQF